MTASCYPVARNQETSYCKAAGWLHYDSVNSELVSSPTFSGPIRTVEQRCYRYSFLRNISADLAGESLENMLREYTGRAEAGSFFH
jgi:hypothetical protein